MYEVIVGQYKFCKKPFIISYHEKHNIEQFNVPPVLRNMHRMWNKNMGTIFKKLFHHKYLKSF